MVHGRATLVMRHAKPVTIGEMEKMLAELQGKQPPQKQTKKQAKKENLFTEAVDQEHHKPIQPELD